jgi:hypothetical protein
MNFFGQMGAFFLALIFGQIVQATHRFDYPVYVVGAVLLLGCLPWLAIDAEKQLPEVGDGDGRGNSKCTLGLLFYFNCIHRVLYFVQLYRESFY